MNYNKNIFLSDLLQIEIPKKNIKRNEKIINMPDKRKESLGDKTTKRIKEDPLAFDPVHFIRSHSKNNDPADIQTQVRKKIQDFTSILIVITLFYIFQIWEVVFEPDPKDPSKTTSKVATCGGNSICIIDVVTGTVLMKYKHKELK